MHGIHKGNDELPEQYGAAWVEGSNGLKFKLPTKDIITISDVRTVKNVADTDPAANPGNKNTFTHTIFQADGTTPVAAGTYTNVTASFGTLTIIKRDVILTSADGTKEYDGQPLTNDTVTVSGDGFVKNEGAAYGVTGSQTLVGESDNSFTIQPKDGTDLHNYDVRQTAGKLIVTDVGMPDDRAVTKTDGLGNSGRKYHVGETVVWVVDVKNVYDAEKTLKVREVPDGMEIVGQVPASLAPGEEANIIVRHVVTLADVSNGTIKNTVEAELGDK